MNMDRKIASNGAPLISLISLISSMFYFDVIFKSEKETL